MRLDANLARHGYEYMGPQIQEHVLNISNIQAAARPSFSTSEKSAQQGNSVHSKPACLQSTHDGPISIFLQYVLLRGSSHLVLPKIDLNIGSRVHSLFQLALGVLLQHRLNLLCPRNNGTLQE